MLTKMEKNTSNNMNAKTAEKGERKKKENEWRKGKKKWYKEWTIGKEKRVMSWERVGWKYSKGILVFIFNL